MRTAIEFADDRVQARTLGPESPSTLELRGVVAPFADWPLRFAGACARSGVSLVRGRARLGPGPCWRADLELMAPASGTQDLAALLLEDAGAWRPAEPRLIDCEVTTSALRDGSVELEVHAWDGLGLLAGVLLRAAGHGLSPVELLLETEGECAFHRVGLRGAGSARASERAALRLANDLARLCTR